jgi:prepilin peptidase CpaA
MSSFFNFHATMIRNLVHLDPLMLAPLLLLLAMATALDIHGRRIPNWLTLGLAAGGLAVSFGPLGTVDPLWSLLGLVTGFTLLFFLFALGAVGGGDVKLLAAVGAWVGPLWVCAIFCAAAVMGMIIVLGQAMWQGRLGVLMRNSLVLILNFVHVQQLGMEHVMATGQSSEGVEKPLPYAAPIFVATTLVLFMGWKMGW